ncbi:MAG: 50S ribosomal protein L20 [Fimbriimonadaceae bacterium]|nr:50S ribosomal protein L20 [Fimbriimonadaceae bacterium]
MRVKGGIVGARRRKKVLKQAKGYWGAKSKQYRAAMTQLLKSGQYAYRDRRNRRRALRRLWITRINAAARLAGLSYSRLIDGLKKAAIEIDRKQLSELAIHDPAAFTAVAEIAKAALQRVAQPA